MHVQLPFAHAFWISRFLFSIIEPKTESDFSENSEQYYCHYYGCDIFIGSCQKSKEVVLSRVLFGCTPARARARSPARPQARARARAGARVHAFLADRSPNEL